ncbi:MAG TPA: calcium-binding protein [Rhizomicrobium sp.]|nr:calcium-binding protein [Rhizomicrobium sp.]
MARFVAGSRTFDMTDWDLSDFGDGAVTNDTATEVDVTGAQFHYVLTGTGLGDFDGQGFPQSGTVTGFSMGIPDRSQMTITGISIDAASFMSYVHGNDAAGLEATLFSGNDSFVGREHDVTLLGYGGADNFNISRGGDDTIQGGDGNDVINPGAAFTAADSIDGGAGTDKLHLDGDYSAGVTFGAATLTNVETVTLAQGFSYKLVLNATSDTIGQSLAIHANTLLSNTTLTADGSAVAGTLSLGGGAGNDTLTGGSGSNTIAGGDGNDTLYAGAGDNIISGGDGNDTMVFTNWNASDIAKGLTGNDTLILNGDFSSGATLDGAQLKSVETVKFAAGHDYNIAADAGFTDIHIDASQLGSGNNLHFDGSAVASGGFIGGAGDDVLSIGTQGDFDLSHGGNDTVTGGSGSDTFYMGAALTAADSINGSGGNDTVELQGNYSSDLVLGPATLLNIANLTLESGGNYSYFLTTDDATVGAGKTLQIDCADTPFTFDGSAETDGNFDISLHGGNASITCGAGNDTISLRLSDAATDTVTGGAGNDTLIVTGEGNQTAFTLGTNVLDSIESLQIVSGYVRTLNGDVAAGQTLNVTTVSSSVFDGSRETDGTFDATVNAGGKFTGGAGDDTINCTSLVTTVKGGLGADTIRSSGQIFYDAATDSTSTTYDKVDCSSAVKFHLWFAVAAVDPAVSSGALSQATFDSDLAADIGTAQLGAHHAVQFTASSGDLAGDHFLIVDANGTAGYQAGQDLVIQLTAGVLPTITTSNFEH